MTPRVSFFPLRRVCPVLLCAGLAVSGARAAEEAVGAPRQLGMAAPSRPAPRPVKAAVRKPAPTATQATALVTRTVRTVRIEPAPAASAPAPAAPEAKPTASTETASPPASPALDPDVKAFCGNVGRVASDARVAWQAAKLTELETALKTRADELEAKIAEHRDWLARREDAARRADETVVAIYARMRPDAAASQLASLDDEVAAAVLMKLNPRNAGAILGEIPAERAARLTGAMTGARAKGADEKKPS